MPIDGPTTGVIVVKDTGGGIDPGDLPKIFEPFFTTKKRTGLGLSVCERIVKNDGGRIEVKSQLGRRHSDDDLSAAGAEHDSPGGDVLSPTP